MSAGGSIAEAAPCKVLLICPRFNGQSFWNFDAVCAVVGAKAPAPPLGLITVAALLPPHWECRLVNRNTEELAESDLDWADMVMTGGMLPQRFDLLTVIDLAQRRGKPVVIGGPDATSSPEAYEHADFRVLGEAEEIIGEFIAAWSAGIRQGTFVAEKFTIDVTKTPIPRYDLLKRDQYVYLGVQFARGCPFTCEFCDIIELYGRVPRVKTVEQILAELDCVYRLGHRGHVDFVDDNFIGNKKAVKALLPHLIAWQKARDYPFEFATEASINLADDDALLALMREANFSVVFVGIESPDPLTLISMKKKQNTRRSLADSVHKIYAAGMFVHAGFIIGFDSEKQSVAEAMVECIEASAIPVCMLGLLYALPNTQLTRRLEREGRLLPLTFTGELAELGAGDQCISGLNFLTLRARRDILQDYRTALDRLYNLDAFFGRLRGVTRMLRRPLRRSPFRGPQLGGIAFRDLQQFTRLMWFIVRRQPKAVRPLWSAFWEALRRNPGSINAVFTLAAFYLHLGPFSRYVIDVIDQRIAALDSGEDKIENFMESRAVTVQLAESAAGN
ncbi:MAG TPA: radical SAM protein [Stellaceae bacterium]|nr:radical SAM protein [Stellaceae bacterium]